MSQLTADIHGHHGSHGHDHHAPVLDTKAVTLPQGSGRVASMILLLIGALCAIVTLLVGLSNEHNTKHALASYLVGFGTALAMALGSLGYVMIFQQTNAGWSAGLRRTYEATASQIWVCAILFLPIALFAGKLYGWMDPAHVEHDPILQHKQAFLNKGFWYGRAVFYFLLWTFLATRLYKWSREQDQTGDKWLTARARRLSAPGLLLFALSTAFAAFDWFMSLDAHWFSTMFGVYYFAGSILTATSTCAVILAVFRLRGKLNGVITDEHFHDQGKLMVAFTIFWAYIAFFQYFLIWYGNLPEETLWFQVRSQNGWENIGMLLVVGHFALPFLLLLWRGVKRSTRGLMLVGIWMILMQIADMFYVVRPAVGHDALNFNFFLDVLAPLAPVCIFLGFVIRKVCSAPLVPINDPRLHESLIHKNYV
ncbi:MAG: hypothetical protein AB7G11_06805 [Phycisphaerales bacterium]